MIDGFRITIRTGIFPNLGACFSWTVLVFSTFSCCWSSRGTFSRVRIHQARNGRFPLHNIRHRPRKCFLGLESRPEQQFPDLQWHHNCLDAPLRFSFAPWNGNETRTFYQRNLNQNVARLRSAVTPIKGTERLFRFVCCWFPISVYKYYVLR